MNFIVIDMHEQKLPSKNSLSLFKQLANKNKRDKFYVVQDFPGYYYLKDNAYLNNLFKNNVKFICEEFIDKYPHSKDHLYKNKRLLNDTKRVIDSINKFIDEHKINAIICFGLPNKTGIYYYTRNKDGNYIKNNKCNESNFYANYFLKDNSDLPLATILLDEDIEELNKSIDDNSSIKDKVNHLSNDNLNYELKFEYQSRIPDIIINASNKSIKNINIKYPSKQYPDGRVFDEYDNKDIKIVNESSYRGIMRTIKWVYNNPINAFIPYQKKIKINYYEGPKASGKTTLINEDIKKNNYQDDEYLIVHSTPKAPNDYIYFSNQLDLCFDNNYTPLDKGPQGDIYSINWDKIKAVYIDRGILSEYVYGQMIENLIAGFQENSVKPYGSISIQYLKHCNVTPEDIKLLYSKNNVNLFIKYFANKEVEKEAIKRALSERDESRLTQYEKEFIHPSNLGFKSMIRLLKNNKRVIGSEWKLSK